MNYYEILGVARTATQSEIKAAYRCGAMRWHPDQNPGNEEYELSSSKDLAHAYRPEAVGCRCECCLLHPLLSRQALLPCQQINRVGEP